MKRTIILLASLFVILQTAFRAFAHKAFQKIQISNVENTPGTPEAATEPLLGTISVIPHDKVFHKPEHDRGVLAANYEAPFQVSDEIELEFEGELYDRLMVFVAANSVRGNVTATQPSAGPQPLHYRWVFEPTLTAPNTPDQTNGIDTFTLEYGDNVQGYETEYLFTKTVEITGEPDEPCMLKWTVGGRQVTEAAFTGALSVPATAYFPFNLAKFYIDTTYANIGTTQKSGMLRSFTWTFETMFSPRRSADGNFHFYALNEDKKTVKLELTYYRDGTNSEAEFDKFAAQTTTYIRIELLSHTEMDSGQSDPQYVWLDGAFKYTEFPATEDEDGTMVVTATAEAFYDTVASKMFGVSVGTKMSAYA